MTLPELIAALEQAKGPSRELDAEIWWLTNRKAASIAFWNASLGTPKPLSDVIPPGLGRHAVERYAPEYTASLDSALTLVDGEDIDSFELYCDAGSWFVKLDTLVDGGRHLKTGDGEGGGHIPALEFCLQCLKHLAALRARQEGNDAV